MPWKDLNIMNQKTEFLTKARKADNFRVLCRIVRLNERHRMWRRQDAQGSTKDACDPLPQSPVQVLAGGMNEGFLRRMVATVWSASMGP